MGKAIAMSMTIPRPERRIISRNHSRGVATIGLRTPKRGLKSVVDKDF